MKSFANLDFQNNHRKVKPVYLGVEIGGRGDKRSEPPAAPRMLQGVQQDVSQLGLASCNRDAAQGALCCAASKLGSISAFSARSHCHWPWEGKLGRAAGL